MAYNELIKNFNRIRDYMRDFYVYGFKSRDEYDAKSAKSYDNERRRIESWLGEYMSFRQDACGKNVFISVDSRSISENPFYKAFKAKSFTNNDILLHFYLLDILHDADRLSTKEIIDTLEVSLSSFEEGSMPDDSTIRKKLAEYVKLGILQEAKRGREKVYQICRDDVDLAAWKEAVDFFAEAAPLGVIGSYLRDKTAEEDAGFFRFKHHYILQTLDAEVLYAGLLAIGEKKCLDIEIHSKKRNHKKEHRVLPLKVYISTQTGRYYLLTWNFRQREMMPIRMDNIKKIKIGPTVKNAQEFIDKYDSFAKHLWGVSSSNGQNTDKLEMLIHVGEGEGYIVARLNREKRIGTVEQVDHYTYRFSADVYDAAELLPWIRTFTGRIVSLRCSNRLFEKHFYDDMAAMAKLYGGDESAV